MQAIVLATVPLIFMLVILGLVTQQARRSEAAAAFSQRSALLLEKADTISADIGVASRSLATYLKSRHLSDLLAFDRLPRTVAPEIRDLKMFAKDDPQLAAAAARFDRALQAALRVLATYRSAIVANHMDEAKRIADSVTTRSISSELSDAKTALSAVTAATALRRLDAGRRDVVRGQQFLFAWALFGVLATVVLAVLFGMRVVRRLGRLAENARTLAAGAEPPPLGGSDEIAQLDGVYQAMFEQTVLANRELQRHRAELSSQNEKLANLNQELGSFTYSVSHDLRAPLRAVLGYAEMLNEGYDGVLDDEGKRILGIVRKEAVRMGTLIDDLLELSRLGREELRHGLVEMETLVNEVVRQQTDHLRESRLVIDVQPLPNAYGDRVQLRQVWQNLIANAIKYSQKGDCPTVRVCGAVENGETLYSVADNGVGFDMQYADKLFGVFQRLHRAEEFPGTGVGLAIVHRVVSRHGGRVWAQAELGAGATFSFALPSGGAHE